MRARIRIGWGGTRPAVGRLAAALVALAILTACAGQAAAVPQNPTRILPRSSALPRPPTPEPWPDGWLRPYCASKMAVNAIAERVRDVIIKIQVRGDLRWMANQLIDVATDAESALGKVPRWKKAQPLIDAYWDVARKTRKAGAAIKRYIQTESQSAAESMLKAAQDADHAAVLAAIKTGQVNPGLNADCTTV
jgi:hypothetical protein